MSLLWTAAINEAKRCLEDPISRARYLATGSAHVREDRRITLSPQFLEHIFDMQMAAMEDPETVQKQAQKEYDSAFLSLSEIFTQWESDGNDAHLKEVELLLARIKYLTNLTQP
jgi:hypothetical protein